MYSHDEIDADTWPMGNDAIMNESGTAARDGNGRGRSGFSVV